MKIKFLLPLLFASLSLAACSPGGDLREWVNAQQQEAKTKVKKPQPPTPPTLVTYQPPPYTGLDAFDAKRLQLAQQGQGANAPDTKRPKELLEGVGLESISYVGYIEKGSQRSAYVNSKGYVYTVHPGNYMGTNYGKITAIYPDRIVLTETVESPQGGWTTRSTEVPYAGDANANQQNIQGATAK